MTAIEQYLQGLISLDDLIQKLWSISNDKAWLKDALSTVLNDKNYTYALNIINKL